MFLVDSHCHLNLMDLTTDEYNLDKVIDRSKKCDVQYILNVCMNFKDFSEVLKIGEYYPEVGSSIGLHPNDQKDNVERDILLSKAQHEKIIAIGETGLDYFHPNSQCEQQREWFRDHIRIAKKVKKPLIIHTRAAKKDTLQILQEENASEVGGVMQCFNEDWDMAKKAMDMNFFISFAGLVTYKNRVSLNKIAKSVPLDKILIETDSPYFSPSPYQDKQNEPAFLRLIAKYLSELRKLPLEEFAFATTQNFFNLFKNAVKPNQI